MNHCDKPSRLIPILSIAGSDCSGGAGIQADLKTFSAHGLYGMSVVLSIVAENTVRVLQSVDVPCEAINAQFEAVFEDILPQAVKIGMLGSCEIINSVAHNLSLYKPRNIVLDPVMFAKNGFPLMPESIRAHFAEAMLPYAHVLTPNIPEASALCGFAIRTREDRKRAAQHLHSKGAKYVLVKGGHTDMEEHNESIKNKEHIECGSIKQVENAESKIIGQGGSDIWVEDASTSHAQELHSAKIAEDVLYDGKEFVFFRAKRLASTSTHGTGCTLSSAIAAHLALGYPIIEAIARAKAYVFGAIAYAVPLGKGYGPTNHLFSQRIQELSVTKLESCVSVVREKE